MDEEQAPRKNCTTCYGRKKTVNEAYGIACNVHATCRKWYIQPNQICKWRAHEAADGALLLEYPAECTVEERTLIKKKQ